MVRWSRRVVGLAAAVAIFTAVSSGVAPASLGSRALGTGVGTPSGGVVRSFRSEPGLHPPVIDASSDPDTGSGDFFLTPGTARGGGLMILNAEGQLVWFDPVARPDPFNLEVQSYRGRPVLTWSQGDQRGGNEDVIMNRSYQTVAVVRAGNGYITDPHDFQVSSSGTAWLMASTTVKADLTSVGGPSQGTIYDCLIQEVDIKTGRVLWQWDAYRHIPLNAGYVPPHPDGYYDAYHLNSLQLLPDGNLLVSARNTWSVYEISTRSGRILWTLGGKYNQFKLGPGTHFEWQHDAHLSGNVLTLFDDAASPQEEKQSSAKVLELDTSARTVKLLRRDTHTPPLLSSVQGSVQMLPNHNVVVGWGSEPAFSEYSPTGRQIFTGSFALGVISYRVFRFPWSAHPAGRPAIAASRIGHGEANVWASWNGATDVARWRVLGGGSASSLHTLTTHADHSFQTQIMLDRPPAIVEVQALNAHGDVLGSSPAQAVG